MHNDAAIALFYHETNKRLKSNELRASAHDCRNFSAFFICIKCLQINFSSALLSTFHFGYARKQRKESKNNIATASSILAPRIIVIALKHL
jgi:hypothetical protein